MTRNLIRATGNLDVIIIPDGVPSWSPLWRFLGKKLGRYYAFSAPKWYKYRAADTTLASSLPDNTNLSAISVQGLLYDCVEGLSSVYGHVADRLPADSLENVIQPARWFFKSTRNPQLTTAAIYKCFLGGTSFREPVLNEYFYPEMQMSLYNGVCTRG